MLLIKMKVMEKVEIMLVVIFNDEIGDDVESQ